MPPESLNRVRELRETRGLSQVALAAAVGLARQSIHAIESGRAMPAVDVALRISRALECSVEALFGETTTNVRLAAEWATEGSKTDAQRVAIAHVGGQWLAYGLSKENILRSADAMIAERKRDSGALLLDLLRPSAESHENVVVVGCAPALGLMADRLNSSTGPGRFLWFGQSSTKALDALNSRRAHVAGVHLVDMKTGEANVPDVRKHAGAIAVVLVTLARWEVGLVVSREAQTRITKISHLARRGVRLVAREPGSGARRLLDRELKQAGIPLEVAKNAHVMATGHLEAARAVSMGAADVGIATRDAAIAFGLDFVPLTEERYDLVVPRDDLSDPRLVRMFDVMTAAPLRRELAALGYDVTAAGTRVAELASA